MTEQLTTSALTANHWQEEAIAEEELLFNAYFEDELDDDERREFEARLDSDPDFARDFETFAEVMGGLNDLPLVFAPDDFVDTLQNKMRARSRGRFFNNQNWLYKNRVPYEVIAIVMIIVMSAAYLMMESPRDRNLHGDLTIDPPSRRQP